MRNVQYNAKDTANHGFLPSKRRELLIAFGTTNNVWTKNVVALLRALVQKREIVFPAKFSEHDSSCLFLFFRFKQCLLFTALEIAETFVKLQMLFASVEKCIRFYKYLWNIPRNVSISFSLCFSSPAYVSLSSRLDESRERERERISSIKRTIKAQLQ